MRIGLFGGTFDPIHVGHLILAERCRDDADLDEVWFLPSYRPPHKTDRKISRFEYRVDMAQLATTGQAAFRVEPIERELPPPSYTSETLAELHRRYPEHEFALILGADSLVDLPHWHEPKRVLERAELIVVPRPGSDLWTPDQLAEAVGIPSSTIRVRFVDCPSIAIASRELRNRVSEGKTIRFTVPRAVEEYVRERGLYRS